MAAMSVPSAWSIEVLSQLYGRVTELRRAWYAGRPHRMRQLDRPVISVGNLVVGGSGKTPVVAALAKLLAGAGERPAILSRGYGRREAADGVVVVSDGERRLASAGQSGDEPYMLAQSLQGVPVFVCPDRYLAGRLAEGRFGCTVHLLDDGFQHVQLGRDVDLLVVQRSHLDERLLPFGTLREPISAARVAGALLVAGSDDDAKAVSARIGVDTVFQVVPRYRPVRALGAAGGDVSALAGRRVVAVAGIARPQRFVAALRATGCEVVREMMFRDHHWFTSRDVDAIGKAAEESGADLIMTTEKDAVRLDVLMGRALSGSPGGPDKARPTAEGAPVWAVLPLELTIEPPDRFSTWLAGRLAAARRRRMGEAA
jgi:tetraacyldisaccharide 4'-kinase